MKMISSLALRCIIVLSASSLWAAEKCTHVHVELNGATVSPPLKVALLETKGGTPITVSVEDGCFPLPEELRNAKSIDIIFQVGLDRIHLTGMQPSAFGIRWNLILRDEATTGPFAAFKNVPARQICVLEFDPGGDSNAIIQTGCRSPMKKTEGSSLRAR